MYLTLEGTYPTLHIFSNLHLEKKERNCERQASILLYIITVFKNLRKMSHFLREKDVKVRWRLRYNFKILGDYLRFS